MSTLKSLLTTAFFFVFCLFGFPITFFIVLFVTTITTLLGVDKRRILAGQLFRTCAGLAIKLNPFLSLKVIYTDEENLPKRCQKMICVSNHISNLDPFCLSWAQPFETKWVSKKSLFSIPFAGWMLSLAKDVPIEFLSKKMEDMRTNKESAKKCMAMCKQHLENDTGMTFFPEGRRSSNGELNEFKAGAFILAIETQAPIIPAAIVGADKVWPVHSALMQPGEIVVAIGSPISTEGMTKKDIDKLMHMAREKIIELKKICENRKSK